MAWRKNDPSLVNDPSYLEPRITTLEKEIPKKIDNTEKGKANGLALLNAGGKVVDSQGNEVEGKVKSVNNALPDGDGNIDIPTFSGNYNDLSNKPVIPTKTSEVTNDSGFITVSSVTKTQVGLSSVQNYGIATQAEAEVGTSSAKYMTPQRTAQAIAKLAPSKANQILIDDTSNLFTATNIEDAMSELFTNVSNGKGQIATAITGKGVTASGGDTFSVLANKIGQISSGKKWASGETSVAAVNINVSGLDFLPRYIVVFPNNLMSNSSHAIYNADVSTINYLSGGQIRGIGGSYVVVFGAFMLYCGGSSVYEWVAFE